LIIEDRYPAPTFFLTYPGHTKERKVKSRVNPSGVELDNATCQVINGIWEIFININSFRVEILLMMMQVYKCL